MDGNADQADINAAGTQELARVRESGSALKADLLIIRLISGRARSPDDNTRATSRITRPIDAGAPA